MSIRYFIRSDRAELTHQYFGKKTSALPYKPTKEAIRSALSAYIFENDPSAPCFYDTLEEAKAEFAAEVRSISAPREMGWGVKFLAVDWAELGQIDEDSDEITTIEYVDGIDKIPDPVEYAVLGESYDHGARTQNCDVYYRGTDLTEARNAFNKAVDMCNHAVSPMGVLLCGPDEDDPETSAIIDEHTNRE